MPDGSSAAEAKEVQSRESGNPGPSPDRNDGVPDPRVAQCFAHDERHHAVGHPGALSDVPGELPAQLRPDRADHARLSAHRLDPAAAGRAVHRSPAAALLADGRHGLDVDRPAAAVAGRLVPVHPRRCGFGRGRELGVSPGKLTSGPHGVRRSLRLCAGVVSGGRQHRLLAGSVAGGLRGSPVGAAQRRLRRADRSGRDGRAVQRRALVCRQPAPAAPEGDAIGRRRRRHCRVDGC